MRKSLAVVVFFVLFSVFFLFTHVAGAMAAMKSATEAKSGLNTGMDQIRVVQQLKQGTSQFEDNNTPNYDGMIGRSVRLTLGLISVCAFDSAECNSNGQGVAATAQALPKVFAMMFSPQATTGTYIADLMNTAGLNIARPVYAQGLGIGFSSLDPILDTWKVFRNVAYLFYVILFLIIGFMIMFRQKISGQAAVTAQQALPNIIVSLITVTFSYAIAGLMIDIMYILMYLVVGLFPNQTFGTTTLSLRSFALNNDIFNVILNLFTLGNINESVYNTVTATVQGMFNSNFSGLGSALGAIGGLSFVVIFSLAMLFATFRLFFELLKTYVSIIIAIVLSPLALMLGALPGNNAFQSWVKSLVANLAVFPGILVILTLAFLLISNSNTGDTGPAGGFVPPYLPGRGSGAAISSFLGLGVLLIIPDLTSQIKKSLGGSGGIFEQFANNFTSSIEKGFKGGELVPGMGITNTSKMFAKQMGGLSGENLLRKAAIGATAGARSAGGGMRQASLKQAKKTERWARNRFPEIEKRMPIPIFKRNYSVLKGVAGPHVENAAKWMGSALGDKNIHKDEKKP